MEFPEFYVHWGMLENQHRLYPVSVVGGVNYDKCAANKPDVKCQAVIRAHRPSPSQPKLLRWAC